MGLHQKAASTPKFWQNFVTSRVASGQLLPLAVAGDRVYSEMNTANRWWETQDKFPPGGAVFPGIAFSGLITRFFLCQ
jgi:hypothetical protein